MPALLRALVLLLSVQAVRAPNALDSYSYHLQLLHGNTSKRGEKSEQGCQRRSKPSFNDHSTKSTKGPRGCGAIKHKPPSTRIQVPPSRSLRGWWNARSSVCSIGDGENPFRLRSDNMSDFPRHALRKMKLTVNNTNKNWTQRQSSWSGL